MPNRTHVTIDHQAVAITIPSPVFGHDRSGLVRVDEVIRDGDYKPK